VRSALVAAIRAVLTECTEKAIFDTASWERPRDLENLPAFLEHFAGDSLSAASKAKGTPHTLVIASAGLRAADITR
jgi:protein CMS1